MPEVLILCAALALGARWRDVTLYGAHAQGVPASALLDCIHAARVHEMVEEYRTGEIPRVPPTHRPRRVVRRRLGARFAADPLNAPVPVGSDTAGPIYHETLRRMGVL
jgi:hypothetical protein